MAFAIKTLWNGETINHEPVSVTFHETIEGILVNILAPYYGDPCPPGESGKPQWGLWDYEVVEAFFLNSASGEYLELEYSPHGQHLGILFKKRREFWKREIPLDFTASIENKTWKGVAVVPWDYLPVGTDKFNIYAIHGQGTARWYEALFPVPAEKFDEPDFHRLEYFGDIDMKKLFPNGIWEKNSSSIWKTDE